MSEYSTSCIDIRTDEVLISAMQGVSRGARPRDAKSGSGGHVGGEDVVGVAVQVLAGSVIAHRGARVSVTGRDLDVPEVDAGIEHGRDEGYLPLDSAKCLAEAWFGM